MSKRRRDAEAIEKPDKANDKETSIEEKRAKASSDGEEMKVWSMNDVSGD